MKIVDTSPINEPSIGRIIEEKCSVGRFSDNCIYLIAEKDSAIAKEAVRLMEDFKAKKETYLNTYELEVVKKVELRNHPKIKERMEKYGDNLLLQLNTPSETTKKFIVAKTEENRLLSDLGLMMYEAERATMSEMKEELKKFAINDTEEFIRLAKNAYTDKEFLSNYFASLIGSIMSPTFGMAMSTSLTSKLLGITGVITHQQRMALYDRFLDNLKKYHKHQDPKIAAELDYVISHIDPSTLRNIFLSQSPKLMEKINDQVNPKRMAEVSTMDLEVRHIGSIDKNRKNDGHYRLFLKKGYETIMVHFSRKSGFVLYLIYLLDRKKSGNDVDTLKISEYKELFGKLYSMVYGINGEKIFSDLMKNFNANDEVQQKGLYSVLKSIRNDMGDACERIQEPPEPFLLPDIASHLAVLPKHIILPPEIMGMMQC